MLSQDCEVMIASHNQARALANCCRSSTTWLASNTCSRSRLARLPCSAGFPDAGKHFAGKRSKNIVLCVRSWQNAEVQGLQLSEVVHHKASPFGV